MFVAEVIMQEYGQEADEWSVGVLMYQLLTGSLPFWDSVQKLTLQQASCVGNTWVLLMAVAEACTRGSVKFALDRPYGARAIEAHEERCLLLAGMASHPGEACGP